MLLPLQAAAQFGPIVPDVCKSCPCGFGGVLAIIQNLVNFVIAIAIIFATIIIAWAGGLYMVSATNPESRSTANKMLINAIVGIIIVLSAWLVVDFVMKTLYGGQFGPWNTILLGGSGDSCVVSKLTPPIFDGNITAVPGQTGIGDGTGVISPGEMTQAEAVAALNAGGVSIKSGVTLAGVKKDAINQAIALKAACGCSVTVTDAVRSTGGANSHGSGHKLDLRLNDGLNSYLQSLRYGGYRGGAYPGPMYYDKCGNEYVKEDDHWDITVNRGVCSPLKN